MPNVNAGSILQVGVANWINQVPVERSGTVTTFTTTPTATLALDASASSVNNYYVNMWAVIITGDSFAQPCGIVTAYDENTKVVTVDNWRDGNPTAGLEWRIIKDYPIQRSWQWFRNGLAIANQTSAIYTTQDADVGTAITVSETAGFLSPSNNGLTLESPTPTSTSTSANVTVVNAISNQKLVQQNDFEYLGSFKLPTAGTGNQSIPSFSDAAFFVKNANGNVSSVFRGHVNTSCAAEISLNVSLSKTGTYSTLASATLLTPANPATALPLLASSVDISTQGVDRANNPFIGVHGIPSGPILFNLVGFGGRSPWMHFRRAADITDQSAGSVEGPFVIYDQTYQTNTRWTTGYYCDIPTEWQTALGGDLMAGCGVPAVSISVNTLISHGPSAIAFSSSDITPALAKKNEGVAQGGTFSPATIQLAATANSTPGYYVGHYINVPYSLGQAQVITAYDGPTRTATVEKWDVGKTPVAGTAYNTIPPVFGRQLVGYPPGSGLQSGNTFGQFYPIWSFGTAMGGMCIPNGTDSLLIFCKNGDGLYTYSQTLISSNAIGVQRGGYRIYDPENDQAGPHTNLSFLKVYAYDLNELAQVKAGTKAFADVKPHGIFTLTLPSTLTSYTRRTIRGVSYDKANGNILVAETIGPYGAPVVHVFNMKRAAPALVTPPQITAYFPSTAISGEVLTASAAVWSKEDGVELSGTVGSGDLISRPTSTTAVFYIGSNPGASSNNDEYKYWYLFANGVATYAAGCYCGVLAYDGATKRITVEWDSGQTPTVGGSWKLVKNYPILRKGQWKRNGVAISGQETRSYSITAADVGQSITYEETAGFVDWSFVQTGTLTPPVPTISSTASSSAYISSASFTATTRINSAADFTYLGSFKSPFGGNSKISVVPANQSQNGQVSLLFSEMDSSVANALSREISIPALVTNSNPNALNTGSITRSSADLFSGWASTAKTGIINGSVVAGTLGLSNTTNMLASNVGIYTDQLLNFFVKRTSDISVSPTLNPFCVFASNVSNNKWASGSIIEIPDALQSALGGDLMSCSGLTAKAGSNSQKPAGRVFSSSGIDAAIANYTTGTVVSGTTTTAVLAVGSSPTNGYYNNWQVVFNIAGNTAGYTSIVTGYNQLNREITFTSFGTAVTAGSTYSLIAPVTAKQLYGSDTPYEPDGKKFPSLWSTGGGSFNFATFIPRGTTSFVNVVQSWIGMAQYGLWITFPSVSGRSWGGINQNDWGLLRLYLDGLAPDMSPGPRQGSVWRSSNDNNFCSFWVYDSTELAQVASGAKTYSQINPSSIFTFALPYRGVMGPISAAFDNVNNRLYVYQNVWVASVASFQKLVHVYSCNKYV